MSGGWHVFHFLMTLLTGGFWLIIWILCALISAGGNRKYDQQVRRQQLELLKRIERQGRK